MSIRDSIPSPASSLGVPVLVLLCAFSGSGFADDQALPSGFSLWGVGNSGAVGPEGQTWLRPPSSWAWDAQPPQLDGAAGVGHRFRGGLNVNVGLSLSHATEVDMVNYHDYFLGLSFGALEGKLWYLPDAGDNTPSSLYYEAGWNPNVGDNLALSLKFGQQYSAGSSLVADDRWPNLSIGASARLGQYGLGLRVIDNGGRMFGGEDDFRLMGSISRPLP